MPNRILKASICFSENLNRLTPFQENFFYRLIVNCDDFGRMDARPSVLLAMLYPLRVENGSTRVTQIKDALRALESAELVDIYTVNNKPFLRMKTWDRHQQIRAKRPKYPGIDESDQARATCGQVPADESKVQQALSDDSTCNHMIADDSKCPRNPNPNPNPNPNLQNGTEPPAASAPPFIRIPLNDGTEYEVTEETVEEFERLYPAVDVRQELRAMRAWSINNPRRKKTRGGVRAFINKWLDKEQDKGPGTAARKTQCKQTQQHLYDQREYVEPDGQMPEWLRESLATDPATPGTGG